MCKSEEVIYVEKTDNNFGVFSVYSVETCGSLKINVNIEGVNPTMFVDTGLSVTLIPKSVYSEKLSH